MWNFETSYPPHGFLTGLGGGFDSFPVAFRHNPRANGTPIMTALFSIMGRGIEVYQFNPYNATDRARLYEVDGSYFVDLDYITNLPEGIPDALQQQTTQAMLFARPHTVCAIRLCFGALTSPTACLLNCCF